MIGCCLILVGGGGHSGYAYALAQELHTKMKLFFLVAQGDILSKKRLSKFGEVDFFIKPRGPKTPFTEFIPRLAKAFFKSMSKPFNDFDVVVSAGSNFSILPAIMAWIKGVPIINIESPVRFTRPSKTACILQHFSEITALHWKEQKKILNGVVVGPIIPKAELTPKNNDYILVTGGTHGHKLLFDSLKKSHLHNIVLQTGKIDPKPYAIEHPEWKILTFTEKFQELLANAKVVVTHFGLTALEATLVYKKPVVIVLNPEWTRTVGAEDAKYLANKLNAVCVSETKLEILINAIEEAKTRSIPQMPSGAEKLAEIILEIVHKESI
jgi:UDP-N-acetylglucosamine--N-acetylmuramyl-(pentapeptide) pyrophosphoryl-undecaprenol N-acetylglucosamine transferase